ncbi:MAG: hypothetical protein NBV67_11950 [Tagaea sp.]|nr:hypothetical protein [Tagaea sp.]
MIDSGHEPEKTPVTLGALTATAIASAVRMYFAPLRAAIGVVKSASEGRGVDFVAGVQDPGERARAPRTVA